jgi:hypothetical protein
MSASRFEWQAIRYEHRDPETGALAVATRQGADWAWYVMPPSGASVAKGASKTAAGAKGKARKASETWKLGRKGEAGV